jgi:hypothetical protein
MIYKTLRVRYKDVGSNRARTNLCFKKNGRQISNKDFPRGQVNGFADNLDSEKN